MRTKYLLFFIFILACQKDLDITEFSSDFADYTPELRIEALILVGDSTAIVRIDKSFLITDTELYDCRDNDFGQISLDSCNTLEGIWHAQKGTDTIAYCGNWNPFLHDIGSDGIMSIDKNGDGKYEGEDVAPDDDGTENNGFPDCGEPNVDNYAEILPAIHDSLCDVSINKITNNLVETCRFYFDENAGHFFDNRYTGNEKNSPTLENIEMINYGAYVPNMDCNNNYWSDYNAQYEFNCDCSKSGFGIIASKEPIEISKPVVYYNVQDSLRIIECSDHTCLQNTTSLLNEAEYDSLYFGKYSDDSYINYASISPNVTFQAVQYMYDKHNDDYKYYHGHAAVGTEMFNIVDDVCVMREQVVTEYYDGTGNGVWDEGELFADTTNNNMYDSGEYFIDLGDDSLDVDTYFYEIFTFSESYRDYYYYSQLPLNDPERTNLRDQNGNPVMGAFGSLSSKKIFFRIIDCHKYNKSSQSICEDSDITHDVCKWHENIILPGYGYQDSLCLPANY